jgi:hypothetical protein
MHDRESNQADGNANAKENDEQNATGREARERAESESRTTEKREDDGGTASRPHGRTEDPDLTL